VLFIKFENVMPALHLIIKGKVQGVFFRACAVEQANSRGIGGWVRNTPDGNVEVLAQGDGEALASFVKWCHKGPRAAKVISVEAQDVSEQSFDGFTVRRG
jgi:acylphosphatase